MEPDRTALKPQWLREGSVTATGAASLWAAASSGADYQGNSVSSRNHREQRPQQSTSQRTSGSSGSQSFKRDGTVKSNGYANFGRNKERVQEREKEKDFDSPDRDIRSRSDSHDRVNRSVTTDRCARDRVNRSITIDRSGFESFSSCRPERDRLSRARSKVDKEVHNLSNDRTRNNIVTFEREFPHLIHEDRAPSPNITTPTQNQYTASDGWNSVLANVAVSNDSRKNTVASSLSQATIGKQPEAVPNSGTTLSMAETMMQAPQKISTLSMAETVMQAPQKISSGPQLSIDAKKIEERTLRQNTLRPMTFPASKSFVTSLSKTKGARNGDSNGPTQKSFIPTANGSVRAPVKTDLSKLSLSGSFKILSRQQNGTAQDTKDCPGNPMSPPSAPVASAEPRKRPVVIQKFKADILDHPLPLLQGDRKSNARDKHRFFESLRTKSSNGSSSVIESGCQPCSVADVKQDPCLNVGHDLSLLHSGMECLGNGKHLCEEANSSEGSQSHQSENEGNISSLETADIADGQSQHSLSELDDTGDEGFQVTLSDNVEGSLSSASADSDDGYKISQSGNEEASSSEATESGDEEHPDEGTFSTEELAFLISLGWSKDEVVQPLELEEIADCVRHSKELEQKLLSIDANPNIKIVLLYLCQTEQNEKPQESIFRG